MATGNQINQIVRDDEIIDSINKLAISSNRTSNISFIGVNRQGTDKENRSNFNRVAGFDFNFVSPNSFWRGKAFFHKSFSPNNPEQSYAHATWFSFSKPNFRFNLNYEYVNKNYNAASGFVPRIYNYNAKTGETILLTYWRQEHDVSYRWYPESKKFNNYGIGINWDSYHLSDYTTTDRSANVFVFANMANNASATLTYGNSYINLIFPTNISGRNEDLLEPGKFFNQSISLSYQSNRSAKFYFGTDGSYGTFYDYYLANANVNINWKMSFWGILALNSTYNNLRKQNNTYTTDLYLIGPRVDITFSRNFYFTVLSQYNTQLQNSNFNARLQWRFKPMSDFFIVYTDNRNTLGYGLKDRSMAAKLVYWF